MPQPRALLVPGTGSAVKAGGEGGLQGQPGAGTEPTPLLSEGPADIHTLGALTPPCFPTSWAGAHGLVTFEKSPKRKFGQLCDIWVFSSDPKLVAGHY